MAMLKRLAATACVVGAAASAQADYQPTSDGILGVPLVAPKSAVDVTTMCDKRIEAVRSMQTKLEAMPLTTKSSDLLAAYDDLYNLTFSAVNTEPGLIKDTNPDAAIRKAAEDCLQRTSEVQTNMSMSRPIFERLQAVEKSGVTPELRYTVAHQIDNYRRAGVDKDEATRTRIAELQKAITETGIEFDRNINADTSTLKVRSQDLAGLPQDYIDRNKPGADGLVDIKMTGANISPILQYADNAELRKKAQTVWLNRAYPANDAVLQKLFAQRAEFASLLGYPNYATFDIANRMAKDPARTQSFIDGIAGVARPIGQAEGATLLARLQKDDPAVASLGAWDSSYAARLVRKEQYEVDPSVVRQYFAFSKVEAGIFKLTEDLFQVQIRPWNTAVWSPEVRAYELVEDGKVIGRFYLDMHPRDNKYTHAAMFPVRIGIKDRVVPIAALLTNFPTGLMEHGQVETYLHEFGHLLHWLFAGQRPMAAQNFSAIENDVIEAPSTLLEEWVWDPETLATFATNEAGQPIPPELVAKMNAGRHFGRAFGTMTQLGLASVALNYYSNDMGKSDLTAEAKQAFARYSLAPFTDESHMHASFGHLTGYGASYYTYQWSEALAADLLSRFRKAGLRDKATAQAYREKILAPGGSASMNVLAKDFLGRDWSVDSYRAELEGATK